MKVVFSTNLDQYQGRYFGRLMYQNSRIIPRVGEFVEVIPDYKQHLASMKLPTRLEVVRVTYQEEEDLIVRVELWYNKTDLELAKLANAPVFG